MKRGNTKSKDAQALRSRAEKRLSEQASPSAPPRSEAEVRALVHVLEVHQIELEMQNEDLVKAQAVARQAADNYAELFDFAPVAYFVLDADGVVCDLNLAAATLLGRDRSHVSNQRFERYLRPDQRSAYSAFRDKLRAGGTQSACELTLRKADGGFCDVLVEGTVVETGASAGGPGWRLAVMDITERRANEARRNLSAALLEMFASKGSSQEYLAGVVDVVRQWSGCQAVGVRVTGAQGELPYAACAGYEPGFLEVENQFSLQRDDCCCLRTVKQAFGEPERALVTPGGSFRCDDAIAFGSGLPPGTQARFGGNCVKFGFVSIAAIPIRCREEIIGVVHLADRRPGLFPPDRVAFLESLTPLIGEAIQRFQTDAKLAEYRDHLEELVQRRTGELEATNAQLRQEIEFRKTAEETLLRTAEELKRSNLELEQFAYAASHDLQEPLRAVGGFVRLLGLRFPDKLDAKAREYVEGAAEGANRMEELITDLLALSRVGTHGRQAVPVNLGAALESALQNLQFSIREAKAQVTNDVLPTLRVDEGQMAQLFQNLIANALKFRKQTPPHIHIGARAEKGRWVIWVQDNGIGIEPQYFERIFQVFQRLHTRKKYPGTGIGLAICKKIVVRHGGTIWVESQPGEGSTFYFSLPADSGLKEGTA
jgi:PAS domain S-box-containing protein